MLDFEVQRCTRRCARTERELKPGESYYSALVPQGGAVIRLDFGCEAWEGPPPEALGWWKAQVPDPSARRLHWAPNDVILHYFLQLESQPGQEDTRYVLALLMVRRRIVRLEETETGPAGGETLVLYCPRQESEYRVGVVAPSEQRTEEIQQELSRLLFARAV